jgi:uncharacterized protein with PIN domain
MSLSSPPVKPAKFAADCMLGKLSKWLRILGIDVLYMNRAEDRDLLLLARRERRTLLTKDHELFFSAGGLPRLFIQSEAWPEQLIQVLDAFQLRGKIRPHSRCLRCNVELKKIPKRQARNLVTPFVFEKAPSFAVCPACGRLFWPGTHFRDMDRTIARILGPAKDRGEGGAVKRRTGRSRRDG